MVSIDNIGGLASIKGEHCKHCGADDFSKKGPRQLFVCDCCQLGAVCTNYAGWLCGSLHYFDPEFEMPHRRTLDAKSMRLEQSCQIPLKLMTGFAPR